MKKCTRCKSLLSDDHFHSDAYRSDGLSNKCKDCHRVAMRQYKEKNADKVKQEKRKYYAANRDKFRQYYHDNKERIREQSKKTRSTFEGAIKTMFQSAKTRARKGNLDFDLTIDFLASIAPTHCPVDGQPLDWKKEIDNNGRPHATSPSLDRIDPAKGYTMDNVRIIGDKWNRWKNNMTVQDVNLLQRYMAACSLECDCGYEK